VGCWIAGGQDLVVRVATTEGELSLFQVMQTCSGAHLPFSR